MVQHLKNIYKYKLQNRKKSLKKTVPKKKYKIPLRQKLYYAPYHLFDRKDSFGNGLCRYPFCKNNVSNGSKFCSLTCKNEFTKYHEENFIWANVRNKIFKRDRFICQICKKTNYINNLECDHINPVSLMKDFGFKSLTLDAFEQYIYSESNLRTLCKSCHKKVTNEFMRNKTNIKKVLNKKAKKPDKNKDEEK